MNLFDNLHIEYGCCDEQIVPPTRSLSSIQLDWTPH